MSIFSPPWAEQFFEHRDNRFYRRGDGTEVWPDAPDCVCVPSRAAYDDLTGDLHVTFAPSPGCPVHGGL